MTRILRIWIAGAAATAFVAAALASDPEKRVLVTPAGERLELRWSAQWQALDPVAAEPHTSRFIRRDDATALHVAVSLGAKSSADVLTDESLRGLMVAMIRQIEAQAVETDLQPIPLTGGRHRGWYVIATDKAPKPGEYQFMQLIVVAAGDVPVFSTTLYNEGARDDAAQVRAALSDLIVSVP